MTALSKRPLPAAFTDAERNMMAALGDMLETADAVSISRRRVAIIVDAAMFDRFNELVDIATLGDGREPDCDDDVCVTDDRHDGEGDEEPNLGSFESPIWKEVLGRDEVGRAVAVRTVMGSQERWSSGTTNDLEDDGGDREPDETDGPGPAFRMDQSRDRWTSP